MEPLAVEQAKTRLQKAEKSLEALRIASNYEEAEEAWSDFLTAASALYSKLEQGSKSNGKSAGWYGRKKHERRKDQLLRYLHHARNSNEHGVERVVARLPGNKFGFKGRPMKFGEREPVKIQRIDDKRQPIGDQVDGFLDGPSLRLVRVHDTIYDDYFDPPEEHLGTKIGLADKTPLGVGSLG
jgi:hypothetical protein